MNTHIHIYRIVGSFALSLALGGLPAAALAESTDGVVQSGVSINAEATTAVQAAGISAGASARVGGVKPSITGSSEEGSEANQSSSTEAAQQENVSAQEGVQHAAERTSEVMRGLPFALESTTTAAFSLEQLKQSIELRSQELDQEEASSSPLTRSIVANANPVRLAVHALLASKGLIGGIGQQVSEIAKQMQDSVATTTNAEAQIQSRGFLAHLFFGGDRTSADVIAQQVAQNQARITDLTKLLADATISAEVKVTLDAQITALQEAQVRLQALAQKEQKAWGLFSWRF